MATSAGTERATLSLRAVTSLASWLISTARRVARITEDMIVNFEGRGTLVLPPESSPASIEVEYCFEFHRTPGRSATNAYSREEAKGRVKVPPGTNLQNGVYLLRMSDGREQWVMKDDEDWSFSSAGAATG